MACAAFVVREIKMDIKILLRENLKRHKGGAAGVFILIFMVSLCLSAAITVWNNSDRYVKGELERMGFGEITAWVSGVSDVQELTQEIKAVGGVEAVGTQELIFSEYEIGEQKSDSEGQLVVYNPESYPYKIFEDDLSGYRTDDIEINPGEIYISPSLCSMFGLETGDIITFPVARSGVKKSFSVKGYFEDPFMGSSMIGMKSFLICEQDCAEISAMIETSGTDGLARHGYMLHIFQEDNSSRSASQFNILINENTRLSEFAEFTHSREAISGFMLTLQNVFTGFILAFVAALLMASAVVLGHSIATAIEQDYVNMGILKTIGVTGKKLRSLQLLQYLAVILPGMAAGILLSVPAASVLSRMTVTVGGMLIPSDIPAVSCIAAFAAVLCVLSAFIWLRTRKIDKITPVEAIGSDAALTVVSGSKISPVRRRGLEFWLALRQLITGKRRYIGTCLIACILVFFASLIGRVNSWLGPEGEGLMDAFNPAELHIAAQSMGETDINQVEKTIEEYTAVTDSYMLAMPGVSVNGVDYTANVITEPERFHMLDGSTCLNDDEVVLTEFVASDLGVAVGDTVTVTANLGSGVYTVSGIYQCANDMGANIGMSREGYDKIGEDTQQMWCVHYFLEKPELKQNVMQALESTYGGDVYLHENSWPGLQGILSAMMLLTVFMYIVVFAFVCVVTFMTSDKLLSSEQRDLGIYKALGYSCARLRLSFSLRFGLVSVLGSIMGILLAAAVTDPLAAVLMRSQGISNFSSSPEIGTILFPGVLVVLLFMGFSWLASGRIKRVRLSGLTAE